MADGMNQNKVAIVTGASRGIGRAIALRLAEEGLAVIVNYVQRADQAQAVVDAILASGGNALAIQADMTQLADIRRLFKQTLEHFGRLDVLVNNAGGAITFSPIADTSEMDFDRTFALNAKGPFFAMQEAAKVMSDGGRIINISSGGTAMPSANTAAYIGSKAALEQFAFVLSKELGSRAITVNVVSSGVTETDGLVAPPEMVAWLKNTTPLGRLGQPDDIAAVVAFVASEAAGWITGQNIRATGGLV
jgi:3-oxoacyl-[acyl-carrier protein] reductase